MLKSDLCTSCMPVKPTVNKHWDGKKASKLALNSTAHGGISAHCAEYKVLNIVM